MKNSITYNVALGCFITFLSYSSFGQGTKAFKSDLVPTTEIHKRVDNYLELKNLGYSDPEIFEDLGNANFLVENYETAAFWYQKLLEIGSNGSLNTSYKKRYEFALQKTAGNEMAGVSENKDWLVDIKADYQINKNLKSRESYASIENKDYIPKEYEAPMSITADGKIAYFSKTVSIKPKYGVFSKKQSLHKIYKAENVKGEWKNIQEIALSPKYYSAKHPTVSEDGKRLFFASNMPGTFGEFDIYVSEIQKDGSFGVAKNLGKKVNTDKDDLYPKIVHGNTICFASEGHGGFGGLDLFMANVSHSKVSRSVNLGPEINSLADDYSISVEENGMGYVMSNRGTHQEIVQRVALINSAKAPSKDGKREDIFEILNSEDKASYTTSVFEN